MFSALFLLLFFTAVFGIRFAANVLAFLAFLVFDVVVVVAVVVFVAAADVVVVVVIFGKRRLLIVLQPRKRMSVPIPYYVAIGNSKSLIKIQSTKR